MVLMPYVQIQLVVLHAHANQIIREIHTEDVLTLMSVQR